ncbi:hypothetical protein J437_LFUL003168 [Ladona fulva]|uniref:Uncharacterized protein n=1 Tax=Ladona fulva TaxID=123851 RepID=A0A8K0PEN6_LADFU|nr:hypothetical protein J437_LFUL003168 [Ladona fulva]
MCGSYFPAEIMKNAKEPIKLSISEELDEVKKDLRVVKEENLKLQAVITDITDVNKRWQKYNTDRQIYVEKLHSTIQDQQEQINNIEKIRLMSKEGDSSVELRQLHADNVKLREEVSQLKRRMENMEREHKEHVEVLEIQVKANKDDWEAEKREKELERQEKEKLEAKVQELQEEISLLKLKLSNHPRRHNICSNAGGCQIVYGDDGRETHCSSHITICQKNSFPAYRTSVHLPCASGHLIPRGSLVYLEDDLVIDGDSPKPKQALELNVVEQESLTSDVADDSSVVSPQKKSFSGSDVKELSGSKDNVVKSILDIPNTNGVTQSRSASTFSSVSSLSLASGGCRLEDSLPNIRDMASSANNLAMSSHKVHLPPLPTSYSDTVVPNHTHKPFLDSRWNARASASPLKVSIDVDEAASIASVTTEATTVIPNIVAEPDYEEGVLTQTREDVICPGCGKVFHPEIHLQFLKHFGECQSRNKAIKSSISKTRN